MSEFNFNPDFYKTKGDISMAITSDASHQQGLVQKISLTIVGIGLLLLIVAAFGAANTHPAPFLLASMSCLIIGGVVYTLQQYKDRPAGIKNNGVMFGQMTSKGASAWIFGIVITGLYVLLYWYPQYLGLGQDGATNTGLIRMFDPLSMFLKGQAASEWFLYGTLYTVAILVMGFKFIWKYRHNKYQVFRTISVMFFQLGFAFLLPELLQALKYPYYDFKNMWPLNYYFFYDWNINGFLSNGNMGLFMLFSGVAMIFIVSPILTYFYGKRWYCSWVCGCGGLAETAGDPYRHLSDKSLKAWKIERWMIHSVLVFVIVMTIAVLYGIFYKNPSGYFVTKHLFVGIVAIILLFVAGFVVFNKEVVREVSSKIRFLIIGIAVALFGFTFFAYASGNSPNVFFVDSYKLQSWYGFFIGAAFSGVVGVGFYPIMGSRVWCRFGCPMAAVLGLQQRFFSRFRITTNSGQCISCGNCSTYCEMGIDVRAYAQKGQNIVRASCVGCGICAAVCPRGVLKLENGPKEERKVIHIRRDDVGFL